MQNQGRLYRKIAVAVGSRTRRFLYAGIVYTLSIAYRRKRSTACHIARILSRLRESERRNNESSRFPSRTYKSKLSIKSTLPVRTLSSLRILSMCPRETTLWSFRHYFSLLRSFSLHTTSPCYFFSSVCLFRLFRLFPLFRLASILLAPPPSRFSRFVTSFLFFPYKNIPPQFIRLLAPALFFLSHLSSFSPLRL